MGGSGFWIWILMKGEEGMKEGGRGEVEQSGNDIRRCADADAWLY